MTTRARKIEAWKYREFTVGSGSTVEQGKKVFIETASNANQGLLVPSAVSTSLLFIGFATEAVVGDGTKKCTVDLVEELTLEWLPNAAPTDDVLATDVGGLCYTTATEAVTHTGSGASLVGRVWGIRGSAAAGTGEVAVEKLSGSTTVVQTGNIAANKVTAGTAYQALRTNSAGTASEWGPDPNGYAAVNATNDVAIQVSQGFGRKITASGDGKNVTVATTGARAGDRLFICRPAIGATSACNIVNGGTGAGTLMAMTSNKAAGCVLMYDGTDWNLVASYQAT